MPLARSALGTGQGEDNERGEVHPDPVSRLPARILIVEDEVRTAIHLRRSIERFGHRVLASASTGDEAIEQAARLCPDLLIMDVRLAGQLDGIQAAEIINRRRPVPTIFITAFDDLETMERALEVRPFGYLIKPFPEPQLCAAMEVALARREAECALEERADGALRMALFDELTGLCNRRGLSVLAEQQFKMAIRTRESLVMLLLDLDQLKTINDELGHRTGDQALQDAACVLTRTFRKPDIIARIGGDEFVVLALGPTTSAADFMVARLRKQIDDWNRTWGRPYTLSLSIGVVACDPQHGRSIEELIMCADAEMYRDKRARRTSQFESCCFGRRDAPSSAP